MSKVYIIKIIIAASVFILGITIFKLLQNEKIFNSTLGRIAITYSNNSVSNNYKSIDDIVKTKKPFTTLDEANFIHWDVKFFEYMKENFYGKDDTWPGVGTYAFSPLFPLIWKLSHLPARYISIFNYLLFVFSLIILSSLFLSPEDFSNVERICLFSLALTLPSVFSFYLPYCESTFIFTMSLALWGLIRQKYWVFYLGLFLFTMSRPSFMIVAMAFITTDVYFLILHKDLKLFKKDLINKLLPILIGMFVTFFIQYLYSGNFFKMFEVHSKFWGHNFQLPTTITDWSTESYGMNIFAIFAVAIPSGIFLFNYLKNNYQSKEQTPVSLFNAGNRQEYLFYFAIIYFIGNLMFVLVSQGGNLNGIHRYVLVSPFFYIFLFILIKKLKTIELKYLIVIFTPLIFLGYLFLVHGPYQHPITFLDMGFFMLVASLAYAVFFNHMNTFLKIAALIILIPVNTVWLCYLFNHFLNNSFIIA